MTLTLKHIAREYDLDPYPLRQALRAQIEHPRNGRWAWPDADDPEYQRARVIALELSKKPGRSSAGSAAKRRVDGSHPTPTPSPPASGSGQASGGSPKRKTRKLSLPTSTASRRSPASKKGST